jgi:hypothetical protein
MNIDDQISCPSSPQRHDDVILEEDRRSARSARSSSAGGGYGYSTNMMNNYAGIPNQDNTFRVVEPVGSLSFGGKLDLYRRKNSEEYERASQRWANCPSEEWLAGSGGERPSGIITSG